MKRIFTVVIAVLFVFVLSSCTSKDVEITVMVYSDNPEKTVSDLQLLPEILSNELSKLGFPHDRIILQSSDDMFVIESNLDNGAIDVAIIPPRLVESETIVKRLSVRMDEINHPDGDTDPLTYQKAFVSLPTEVGGNFTEYFLTFDSYDFTVLNSQNICTLIDDEDYVTEFAEYLGMTPSEEIFLNLMLTSSYMTSEVFTDLKEGVCDTAIVNLEDIGEFQSLWDDVDETIYEELTVLHIFEPIEYDGLYVKEDADVLLTMSVVQAFIQISAHSSNQDIQEALGYDSYYIPE